MKKLLLFIFFIFTKSKQLDICLVGLSGNSYGCEMITEGIKKSLDIEKISYDFFHSRKINTYNKEYDILIFSDILWYENLKNYKNIPKAKVKIAYSMFESSKLPKKWVKSINKYFDAVILPDIYLNKVYEKSGVTKEIFTIPMPIPDLYKIENNNTQNNVFTFGIISGLDPRKCLENSVYAFYLQFKNNDKVKLKIHSSWSSDAKYLNYFNNFLKSLNCKNIEFKYQNLSRDQSLKLYEQIDCLIACSPGEGFSITPRESIKARVPVICLNYGVQKSICNSRLILAVNPSLKHECIIDCYGGYCGDLEKANPNDISNSMLEMYKNYKYYKNKVSNNYEWLKQFTLEEIGKKFKEIIINIYNQKLKTNI